MSWDVTLGDDRGHVEGDWNYTHNVNPMISAAAADRGITLERSWWDRLDGMEGCDGARYIGLIIKGLEADPDRFRAMDPENGWGSYNTLLPVLHEMHTALPEWPCVWEASG